MTGCRCVWLTERWLRVLLISPKLLPSFPYLPPFLASLSRPLRIYGEKEKWKRKETSKSDASSLEVTSVSDSGCSWSQLGLLSVGLTAVESSDGLMAKISSPVYTDQALHHDNWQVKWITLIISSAWHLLVGGTYQAASENVVIKVDVLEAGKMGKCNYLSKFVKGHIVMARPLGHSISKTAALVRCFQSAVVSTKSGPRKEQWWTGDRAGQHSLMHVGSEGCVVQSNRRATNAQTERCQNT